MCGISGVWCCDTSKDYLDKTLHAMGSALAHRGPDDAGIWCDPGVGIGLGHRRLSILDLSSEGRQPMESVSGRYLIVYNGEIYNFRQLREELIKYGHKFRGGSDTEVVLAAIDQWGLEQAVPKFTGMFSFALWDRKKKTLNLVRDRIGEKPLFYGWYKENFIFASELKAFKCHPAWQGEIDRRSLALFIQYSYVPLPYSIFKNIFKLSPGCILSISSPRKSNGFSPHPSDQRKSGESPQSFWSIKETVEYGCAHQFSGSHGDAVESLDNILRASVKRQMVADVPLGAFLSGGIDSSTVVALMQAQSERPVKTFTIGFHEKGYNEAEFAKKVSAHLGTDHTELYVTPEEIRDVIPRLAGIYDEPFADSSQMPTFLISELARRHVTVSLSGDGGDELFAGYNRYFWGRNIWNKIGSIPLSLWMIAANGVKKIPPHVWQKMYDIFSPMLPKGKKIAHAGDRVHKLADIIDSSNPEELYGRLISFWRKPENVVLDLNGSHDILLTNPGQWAAVDDFTMRMMFLDLSMYLPDDILVKVDRAAMAVSLETRLPFLDQKVVEFAWRLPLSMKIKGDQGKWILRQVLYKYIPKELIERPKMGFAVPIDSWLRGPLKGWAEDLLNSQKMVEQGYFSCLPIQEKWQEHLSSKRNWQYLLWNILMFQAWYEEYK